MTRLPWRVTGVLLLAVLVVVYEPTGTSAVQRLLIPVAMAVATWLMVQNPAAVLLGAGALAAIHGDLSSGDWIVAYAYPLLALISGVGLAIIAARRFARRIRDTREARWRGRGNAARHQDG